MNHEFVTFTGNLNIVITGPDGEVKEDLELKNLVVTAGKTWIAARLVGVPAVMSHMAVGTGAVAAAAGDTALGTELTRVALTSGTSSAAIATYVANFPAGTGTGALTEAGVFNAGAAGTMLCRTVFPVVNKGALDVMSITWDITAS